MIEEMIERILIQRNKEVDDMILGEIRKIATENGVDTIITLNDKAIIQALKKSTPMKPLRACGHNTNRTMNFCPVCGQALDWSDTKCPEKQDQV